MSKKSFLSTPLILIVIVICVFTATRFVNSQVWCCGDMWQYNMGKMQEMMRGRLPPGIEPSNLPNPDSPGAKLLVRYCTQCHNLPSPAMHTSEEWPKIAQRMFGRLSMMSGMRKERTNMMWMKAPSLKEQEIIVYYLKAHSLKTITPETLSSDTSPDAITFKNACSQCHNLPDPQLHTVDEWPDVVERMQVNMKIMGENVISDMEKKKIISYLVKHAKE